jgi:hypothetical protein
MLNTVKLTTTCITVNLNEIVPSAIPNMKLVMEKNSGEKKTRHPDSERVGAWAIIQHAKLGRLESENSESKNLS